MALYIYIIVKREMLPSGSELVKMHQQVVKMAGFQGGKWRVRQIIWQKWSISGEFMCFWCFDSKKSVLSDGLDGETAGFQPSEPQKFQSPHVGALLSTWTTGIYSWRNATKPIVSRYLLQFAPPTYSSEETQLKVSIPSCRGTYFNSRKTL